jgi:UDP-GlcNAc:undecaprenyl-phosphate/decaprenyl-phosphate GlcNAc-1-phosphate transferase
MIEEILSDLYIVSILIAIFSFLLVYFLIPKIIFMVNHHNLSERPNSRSSHNQATPSMGGLSFFVALILSIFFIKYFDEDNIGLHLVAALTFIFIIGLKDDLAYSTPRARLLVEILAISIIFLHRDYHANSLEGLLGIFDLPQVLTDIVHILITLTIINAFNLIDGIDGLAPIIGITIFTIFGLIFFSLDLYFYFLLCLSLIFMLLSFMRYNFSNKNKIFMGDTGSLLIGFCISILSLKFLTMENSMFEQFAFGPENKFFIIAGIIAVPLFDFFRVIGVRLLQRKQLFEADNNHIHHIFLGLGMPHYSISMALGLLNYALAIVIIYFSAYTSSFQMFLILALLFIVFWLSIYQLKKRINKNNLGTTK